MIISNVTRTYSRSINTKNYGVPESWIKIEATYTAECESGDDPVQTSKMIYDQAKADVLGSVKEITDAIAAARTTSPTPPTTPNGTITGTFNGGTPQNTLPGAPRQL